MSYCELAVEDSSKDGTALSVGQKLVCMIEVSEQINMMDENNPIFLTRTVSVKINFLVLPIFIVSTKFVHT